MTDHFWAVALDPKRPRESAVAWLHDGRVFFGYTLNAAHMTAATAALVGELDIPTVENSRVPANAIYFVKEQP